jgi:pyruvate/2-oxoacid:ferredoxin oxidoreductase alpha subunit
MAISKKQHKKIKILDGNQAAALGAKLSRVQVIAAYPITPQTPVTENLSEFVEKGELKAEYVAVESEHSALAVCASASMVGARTFTATSSHGLAYMHEMLHWTAGARLPVVMACVNRAIGAPWNILNDQQDSISQRDTGWIQIYARNNQEIIDSMIQAYRIAEQVYVPVMVCYDGYLLSHAQMPVFIPSQDDVDKFLLPYRPHTILDPENPKNYNLVTLANPRFNADGVLCHGYMEIRQLLQEALQDSLKVISSTGSEFQRIFGRQYNNYLWSYGVQDTDIVIVVMGSLAMEALVAQEILQEQGYETGVLGIRVFRPFPIIALRNSLKNAKRIFVFDKDISYGNEGACCTEIKAALYGSGSKAIVKNFIVGLGGRDVSASELAVAVKRTLNEKSIAYTDPEWLSQL